MRSAPLVALTGCRRTGRVFGFSFMSGSIVINSVSFDAEKSQHEEIDTTR
jgi:hypothetical protein